MTLPSFPARFVPRLAAGAMTLVMLAGCSPAAPDSLSPSTDAVTETVQSTDPLPAPSGDLRLVSSGYGVITSSGVATDEGYYGVESFRPGTVRVVYTDYASCTCTCLKEFAFGGVAESGSTLYLEIQVYDPDADTITWEILSLDPATGETDTLFTTDQPGDRLTSAWENRLVFDSVSDSTRSYYTVDVTTGEKSAPLYTYDYTAQNRIEQAKDGFVYSLRPGEGDQWDLCRVTLETGEEEKLAVGIPIYDADGTRFSGFFDNHAEIETSDTRDMENIRPLKYSVDLSTGEVRQSTLSYQRNGNSTFAFILAETPSDFLVRSGSGSRTVTVVDESGTPSQVEDTVPQYALIAKSDYWSSNPAYREIKDAF